MSLSREAGRSYNRQNDFYSEEQSRSEEHAVESTTYDHSTDTLKLHAANISVASKKLDNYRDRIRKKMTQTKSKKLESCKEKYRDTLSSIKEEIKEIKDILDKRDPKPVRTQSQRAPKKQTTPAECLNCKWKDSRIQELEKEPRLNDVLKTHVPIQQFYELSKQKDRLDREIGRLHQHNQDEKLAKEDAIRRLNDVLKTHVSIQKFEELSKQKDMLDREIGSLHQHNQAEKLAKEDAIRRLNEVSKTFVPVHRFEELKTEKARLDREIEKLCHDIKTEREAKEDALKRLSSMASSKLRDNNPNITDLSDQNRPTKISEKLSELYDNQWTDTFDVLERQNMQEREIINALLQSLMIAYHECHRLANEHFFETVQGVIECPKQDLQPSRYQVVMTDQLKQQIKEFRKSRAPKVIKEVERIVKPRIPLSNNRSQHIDSYLSKCVEIGWLMVVQDPPLVLVDRSTFGFDTNTFKDYTKRGRYIDYVVWPALLLHDKGPLLGKGVAQGCDVKPAQTQSLGRALSKKTGGQNSRMLESCILQTSHTRPVVDVRHFQAPVRKNAQSSTNV